LPVEASQLDWSRTEGFQAAARKEKKEDDEKKKEKRKSKEKEKEKEKEKKRKKERKKSDPVVCGLSLCVLPYSVA